MSPFSFRFFVAVQVAEREVGICILSQLITVVGR